MNRLWVPPIIAGFLVLLPSVVSADISVDVLSLTCTFGANICGAVIDSREHHPVPGVAVYVVRQAEPPASDFVVETFSTDKDGRFLFLRLPVGHYRLEFQKDGYELRVINDVIIAPPAPAPPGWNPFVLPSVRQAGEAPEVKPVIVNPVILNVAIKVLDDSALARAYYCNQLVNPSQTADIYVVCADRL